jgi:hypothetical protein
MCCFFLVIFSKFLSFIKIENLIKKKRKKKGNEIFPDRLRFNDNLLKFLTLQKRKSQTEK